MTFSIMITTRNRSSDLRRSLTRLNGLKPGPREILVCADECTDDTVTVVEQEFPGVRLLVNPQGLGSVASRDRLLHLVAGDWILSLDDDSYPLADDFFGQLLSIIGSHPEAAVITFPELREGGLYASASKTPASVGHYVSAYPNCAAVMNRQFYLQQPGFPPKFVHMYEEPDYTLQCYAAGAAVWFEPSLVIRHHLSAAQRQPVRRHHQNARNEMWSVWMRCPWPWLLLVSLFRVWRQFRYACSEGMDWAIREPCWWLQALRGLPACRRNRLPIPWRCYLAWMKLARRSISSAAGIKKVFTI
jgi:N-acetylglucosaminyl-diphospho-decaprenol L-rhamnosyltransferase